MLMMREYRDDLIDHIKAEPDETFTNAGTSKADILKNESGMESAWMSYQKAVQEYSVPAYQAFREAISDVFGIPEPNNYPDEDD